MTDNNKDIALKAWEVYQNLTKEMGDSAWKTRATFFATTTGLVGYAYTTASHFLYLVGSILSVLFFFLEAGHRRIQIQYIQKSISIERTLNDFIANEETPTFPDSIGTDIDTPQVRDFLDMFAARRAMLWIPYSVVFLGCVILFFAEPARP